MTSRSRCDRARLRDLLIGIVALGIALPCPMSVPAAEPSAAAVNSDPHYFGGLWESERFFFMVNNTPKLPETKEMVDRYAAAMKGGQIIYTAWTSCRPGAFSAMSMVMHSIVVLQTEADITISLEEPRMTRRIRLNSQHPRKIAAGYIGDSIGHWEGDTLVVDTIGFNGNFELDAAAQPTSTRLHTVERLTKSADGKRIAIEVTIDDPQYYSAPFKIERAWIANPKGHQMEYDCMENPRSEEFEHTLFVKELYRPTCMSYQGEGMAPSRMICGRPEDQPQPAGK